MKAEGPHAGQPVLRAGPPAAEAGAAVILVHGRGASARDILTLAPELNQPGLCCLAPQAAGASWYPWSFLAPIERNEPGFSSGLSVLGALMEELAAQGISAERLLLLGFSQGACLRLEFAARRARRFGGVVGFTGGLIGPPDTPRDYVGSFAGTPTFLGAGDPDPHVPWSRVQESAEVFRGMGAEVDLRRYPGMGHAINREEIDVARLLAAGLLERNPAGPTGAER
ncbi:MAG: dienelactone hydrolase family protein [Gemmatimonadota bacterium]|nr:MAG: dienelactone hydrolase family protein [Gemmatimonadota bacterium]